MRYVGWAFSGLIAVGGLWFIVEASMQVSAWASGQEDVDRRHGERIEKQEAISSNIERWIGNEEARRALERECERVRDWCSTNGVAESKCPLNPECN